jgi:hypothetical protein
MFWGKQMLALVLPDLVGLLSFTVNKLTTYHINFFTFKKVSRTEGKRLLPQNK